MNEIFFLSSVKRNMLKSGTCSAIYSRWRPILSILVTNHWFLKGEFVSIVAKYFQSLFDISDVNEAQWHQGFNVRGWIDMLYKAPIFLEGRSPNPMDRLINEHSAEWFQKDNHHQTLIDSEVEFLSGRCYFYQQRLFLFQNKQKITT